MTTPQDRRAGQAALAEAVEGRLDRAEQVTHAIVREGPRWRVAVATMLFTFLVFPPVLTIGYITLSDKTQSAACNAVSDSNTELIRFLRARLDREAQVIVTDLAKEFDDVERECRN